MCQEDSLLTTLCIVNALSASIEHKISCRIHRSIQAGQGCWSGRHVDHHVLGGLKGYRCKRWTCNMIDQSSGSFERISKQSFKSALPSKKTMTNLESLTAAVTGTQKAILFITFYAALSICASCNLTAVALCRTSDLVVIAGPARGRIRVGFSTVARRCISTGCTAVTSNCR